MAKQLKFNIKNTQIAKAIDLSGLKNKLSQKKAGSEEPAKSPTPKATGKAKSAPAKAVEAEAATKVVKEEAPRRARSKSVFAETPPPRTAKTAGAPVEETSHEAIPEVEPVEEAISVKTPSHKKTSEELRRELFEEEAEPTPISETLAEPAEPIQEVKAETHATAPTVVEPPVVHATPPPAAKAPTPPQKSVESVGKLGPTGRHMRDLLPPKPAPKPPAEERRAPSKPSTPTEEAGFTKGKAKTKIEEDTSMGLEGDESTQTKKGFKPVLAREFRDVKPTRKTEAERTFDARDRHGLRDTEEEQRWRKKRMGKVRYQPEEIAIVRPTELKVRTPISIKDLASEMKLKSSELISKLFMQGLIVTLNDLLDDETTIQLLGQEFGCNITIDTSEAQRIRITDKTVKDEIHGTPTDQLVIRPPVVAFMGHVDHGKTSLIDAIRKSNRVASEAGAITQHIGAFRCHTDVGDIAILDTPGHEAFSAMRARGADVTDIVVLVVAGDEGIRQQTLDAIQNARSANVTIVVALNKSDKPGFNPDNVYRQLADHELLPEVWGGQTLTVNTSAVTGAGVKELLEMLALQAEVLELKANPKTRARGAVLESEMHKGMGAVATVLVQNGTLRLGDALVFGSSWGHVKTMRDEFGRNLKEAPPCTPVAITGLSGMPEAGEEFIVVSTEREAREIAEVRRMDMRQASMQQRKVLTTENLLQQATPTTKKILNVILRADVQGSLEALKVALEKIESQKAEINVISAGVGEISESDIQLGATSKGVVIGFHTGIEAHAEPLIKQLNVQVRLHDIIYHAIDDVKVIMTAMLDKIAKEVERGKAEVKALFKSSQVGMIAGCQVIEGTIQRNHHVRIVRNNEVIGQTQISSLKRVKEDVREVAKGLECGIALAKFSDLQVGDILVTFEISYIAQEL